MRTRNTTCSQTLVKTRYSESIYEGTGVAKKSGKNRVGKAKF